MSRIRDIAQNCEAKLHGFRRTQDGVVVSFVVHPEQVPQALALDPLGSRYMLAFVAIGDDEQPLPPGQSKEPPISKSSAHGKARYASSTERKQALVRACAYAKDARFRSWLRVETEAGAVDAIRHACGIESRREIESDPRAYDAFIRLETDYKIANNLMAAPR